MTSNQPPSGRNILFISYYYPPLGGVGAQRVLRFVRYLSEFGWKPYVLAAEPNAFFPPSEPVGGPLGEEQVVRSEVLEPLRLVAFLERLRPSGVGGVKTSPDDEVTPDLKTLREDYRELPVSLKGQFRAWLFIPDDRLGWIPEATRDGLGLLSRIPFSAILSSSAPYSAHLVAWRLARLSWKLASSRAESPVPSGVAIPWIADFRDLWSTNPFLYFPTPLHQRANALLERLVVEKCDRVLTCTPGFREDLASRYSYLETSKFSMLTNSFDPADFTEPDPDPYPRFTIAYVGDFYGPQTPVFFLLALRQFLDRRPEATDRLQVLFAGPFENRIKPLVKSLQLEGNVTFLGFLTHERSIDVLRRSHVLLLVLGTKRGAEAIYPAKVFEYLGAKKPILALVPSGLTYDLVKDSGVGFMVQPQNEEAIAKAIERLFVAHEMGELPVLLESDDRSRFDARTITGELAALLEKTIAQKKLALSLKEKRR